MQNIDWYHLLKKSKFNPPHWIFAPVWTIIYCLMFISLAILIYEGDLQDKTLPLTLFITQLFLNFIWAPIFFGIKKIGFAIIICFLLCITVILTAISFYQYSKIAGFLFIPYILWNIFALYLNFMIWKLNPKINDTILK